MESFIPPPVLLQKPLNVPYKLLLGPGPSNCPPRILDAASLQMLGHLNGEFLNIMEETKIGIKYAFQTKNEYTFAVSGTGHCAMETAIANVLVPGNVFLCIVTGIWGERAMEIGRRLGADCHKLTMPIGKVVTLDGLEEEIIKVKPTVLFVCHGESSTGLLQPLEGIGALCKQNNCLFIVDAVASLGACPLYMDNYGIDVLYSASQKVLNAPPGISPISFSEKAVQCRKNKERNYDPPFYMDLLHIGNYWNCDGDKVRYHHTAPINLVYALREALSILVNETLEISWKRHQLCSEYFHKGLQELGLTLLIPEKAHRLPSITAVNVPAYVKSNDVVQYFDKKYSTEIAGGLGPTYGHIWRIGLMGNNATINNAEHVLKIMKEALKTFSSKPRL